MRRILPFLLLLALILPTGNAPASPVPSWIPELYPAPAPMTAPTRETTARVLFGWPLAWPLSHPHLRIVDYVDEDPTNGIVRDYMGDTYAYDGHQGTDINLNSFRDMDAGVPIRAAANGRVYFVEDQNYDREVDGPHSVPGNGIGVVHEDGTYAIYWHIRTNSAMVQPGEYVREGQPIAMVGSAGTTTNPHLHFEVGDALQGGVVDPWGGPFNPLPSRWKAQEPYVGHTPLRMMSLSVTTNAEFANEGDISSWWGFKNQSDQPLVFGIDEPNLKVWSLVSGVTRTPFVVEVRKPDGTLFARLDGAVPVRANGQTFQFWDVPFAGAVSAADYGSWTARAFYSGAEVFADTFVVGETSRYAPRFYWISGRSFHASAERREDIVQMSYLGAPVESLTFALEDAPSNVSLRTDESGQPIVVIDPIGADMANVRSREFTLSATDPYGAQDRMHYHLVNDGASTLGSPPIVSAPASVAGAEGDTIVVEISVTDPDGDAIASITADLSALPVGHGARFESSLSPPSGRLVWPTRTGDHGSYPVAFRAETSLGGIPVFGFGPIVQDGDASTTVTVRSGLTGTTFTTAADRTIRLFAQKPRWCLHVASPDGSFDPGEIDPASVRLRSPGTGGIAEIAPVVNELEPRDSDRDSLPEAIFCFARDALQGLFSKVVGKQSLSLTLLGTLRDGASFTAPVDVEVIGRPVVATDETIHALTVAPNPARGGVTFRLRDASGARSTLDVFNLAGRRVRHIDLPGGVGSVATVRWDGRDEKDQSVGAGIYWVRFRSGAKTLERRVVFLR